MSDLAHYKPLPPQRWGFLPTSQFWVRAWLTPIAVIYWVGYVFFFSLAEYIHLNWWQTALGVYIFHEIWGGLVERHYRRTLARRQKRSLPITQITSIECGSKNLTGTVLPARREPVEFSPEDWEGFTTRVFGRWSELAQRSSIVGLCLLFFHPGWEGKIIAVVLMIGSALIARASIRRWRREAEPRARPAIDHLPRQDSP